MRIVFAFFLLLAIVSCKQSEKKLPVPVIGFMDALKDETLAQADSGFFDALAQNGYSEDSGTVKILYRNAQNDIPTLTQIADYFISQKVNLIATNPSLSTITACQKTKEIPVCMMVSPSPANAKLLDANGKPPSNLFGIYEETWYIDTSVALIRKVIPAAKMVGTIYNEAEPQSRDALAALKHTCDFLGLKLEALPVNNSSETQLVLNALLNKGIDVFFAPPDNTIFASFPTIVQACNEKHIPVFTSEAGLVKLGAVAAYGADMYQWGFQTGQQAAQFLSQGSMQGLSPELVNVRKKVFSPQVAATFGLQFDSTFEAIR